MDELTTKFEKEFSLVLVVSSCDGDQLEVEVDERWIVDSGYCSHMIGMQDAFLTLGIVPKQLV